MNSPNSEVCGHATRLLLFGFSAKAIHTHLSENPSISAVGETSLMRIIREDDVLPCNCFLHIRKFHSYPCRANSPHIHPSGHVGLCGCVSVVLVWHLYVFMILWWGVINIFECLYAVPGASVAVRPFYDGVVNVFKCFVLFAQWSGCGKLRVQNISRVGMWWNVCGGTAGMYIWSLYVHSGLDVRIYTNKHNTIYKMYGQKRMCFLSRYIPPLL